MSQDLGPVATRKLFENDDIRVWEMDLAPGEICGTHHHTLDYVLYILEGASVGVESPQHQPYTLEASSRTVYLIPAGGIESARNVGRTRFHEALFEMKRPPKVEQRTGFTACEALAGTRPQPGTLRILENERLRVSETVLMPGAGTRTGSRYDSVVFVVEGGKIALGSDGATTTQDRATNSVLWHQAGTRTVMTNVGPELYREVSLELK